MPEEISYEFDSFRLDHVRRNLFHNDESRSLTPTAFDLLVVFEQNHGQTLSKTQLIKRVWADAVVTDNNFNVTLNAVRRAMGESGRQPRYVIKVPGGYRFVADVREVGAETSGLDALSSTENEDLIDGRQDGTPIGLPDWGPRDACAPSTRLSHVLVSCTLYAAL